MIRRTAEERYMAIMEKEAAEELKLSIENKKLDIAIAKLAMQKKRVEYQRDKAMLQKERAEVQKTILETRQLKLENKQKKAAIKLLEEQGIERKMFIKKEYINEGVATGQLAMQFNDANTEYGKQANY